MQTNINKKYKFMKGVIVSSIKELIEKDYGRETWKTILKQSGCNPDMSVFSNEDIDDNLVMKIIDNICRELKITEHQFADSFGDYWINNFAKRIYFVYFNSHKRAIDFLLDMERVHENIIKKTPNAKPPKFDYERVDGKTLIMKYNSHRNMYFYFLGLIKAVGKYYDEKIDMIKLSDNKVKLMFN